MGTARVAAVFMSITLVGCAIVDVPGSRDYRKADAATAAACAPEPAKVEIEKVDVSLLDACECKAGGKAHCVSAAKLPASLAKPLEECEGAAGRCVPDSILESGGREPFRQCRSSGAEGRCVSLCVPKVAQYAELLTRGDGDSCDAEERCVPCSMPDGSSSGICEVGSTNACGGDAAAPPSEPALTCPFNGTPMNVTPLPVCAPGGRCVSETVLDGVVTDANKRTELEARLASCATGYCVPEEYLKNYGQYKPPACRSFAGIEGRCFSTVFKDVSAQAEALPQDSCAASERCVPCFNPADGSPSGACSTVSCDAPTTTPPVLAGCCEEGGQLRGKCVPRGDIPTKFQSRLASHECDSAELCMPTENIDLEAEPTTCAAAGGASGVCVSRCLAFGTLERLALSTGTCRADQLCAPCINPANGQPSGVPGCR